MLSSATATTTCLSLLSLSPILKVVIAHVPTTPILLLLSYAHAPSLPAYLKRRIHITSIPQIT